MQTDEHGVLTEEHLVKVFEDHLRNLKLELRASYQEGLGDGAMAQHEHAIELVKMAVSALPAKQGDGSYISGAGAMKAAILAALQARAGG